MREKILNFLRVHPGILNIFWRVANVVLTTLGLFVPIRSHTMLITSFAGRKFDDSPKAIYEEILKRHEFDDWEIIWAFVDPTLFEIPRGKKIRIDTWAFFMALLYSRVWISNSGMDRNINIKKKGIIKIETWHGTPFKKIGEDQNAGTIGNYKERGPVDSETIRCAQSEFDREIFARVFNADKNSILLSDLPRNDALLRYTSEDICLIRSNLGVSGAKKVILYMPTYREYLVNEKNETYLAPPMNLDKWEKKLGDKYVLLMRAHYAVVEKLKLKENGFVKDVSSYPSINDLYAVADILISDYSSAYIDYSILDKPMLCFAYDEKEYTEKRGLYVDLHKELPCPVDADEDTIINRILNLDYGEASLKTKKFHEKYAPYAGNASTIIVNNLIQRLKKRG